MAVFCWVVQRDLRYLELLYLHVVKGEIADRLDVLLEMFASPDPPPADAPASRVVSEENLAQLIGEGAALSCVCGGGYLGVVPLVLLAIL